MRPRTERPSFLQVLLRHFPHATRAYCILAVVASELDVIAEGKLNLGMIAECVAKNVVFIRLAVKKMRSIMEIKQQIEVSRV